MKNYCDRCAGPCVGSIMSMFNTDTLCRPCKEKERKHPDYERAREAEAAAVRAGNYNFRGIGKPGDL